MSRDLPLTLAFLGQKPLAAGRALASMSASDAALFLDSIPTRLSAPVLAAMGPWSASEVLGRMAPDSAAAILLNIDYLNAAAILRNLSVSLRKSVLAGLPQKLRRDFETSLVFPDGTVGAHMTTAFMTLTAEHVAEDAIDLIRRSDLINPDVILIVGVNGTLAGAVTAADLLRHAASTPLVKFMDTDIESVAARAHLSATHDLKSWDHYSALPVLSRQKHVIGLLHRKVLTRADDARTAPPRQATTTFPLAMLDAFVASTLGLTRALVGAQSATAPERRADRG